MLEVLLGCGADDGARNGMREVLFQARREAKDLGPVPSVERDNAFHLGLRLGKRAGLVEDDRVGLGECLEMLRTLHREARLGSLAHGGQNRDRPRELERTRVVNHKRSRGFHEAARGERDNAREQEVPRHDAVGQPLALGLGVGFHALGHLDQRDDGAKLRLARRRLDADENLAVFARGAREDVVSHRALDGKRLAGQGRLVHHGNTALDHAVDAYRHAGAHGDKIAGLQIGSRDGRLLVATDELRVLRRTEQGVDQLVLRACARVVFQRLAQIEKEHRRRRRREVTRHERDADGRRIKDGHIEPRMQKRVHGRFQEKAVMPDRMNGAQGRGKEPFPREV